MLSTLPKLRCFALRCLAMHRMASNLREWLPHLRLSQPSPTDTPVKIKITRDCASYQRLGGRIRHFLGPSAFLWVRTWYLLTLILHSFDHLPVVILHLDFPCILSCLCRADLSHPYYRVAKITAVPASRVTL